MGCAPNVFSLSCRTRTIRSGWMQQLETMREFEARLVALAGDVLTALGRGEIAPDAPAVRAAAAALAELRQRPEQPESASGAATAASSDPAARGGAPSAR